MLYIPTCTVIGVRPFLIISNVGIKHSKTYSAIADNMQTSIICQRVRLSLCNCPKITIQCAILAVFVRTRRHTTASKEFDPRFCPVDCQLICCLRANSQIQRRAVTDILDVEMIKNCTHFLQIYD